MGKANLADGMAERLARKDRWIVLAATGLIVALAAAYTIAGVGMNMSALDMTRMARPIGQPMTMGAAPVWTASYAALIFLMWWIMMIAMMTPSAAPLLLLFAAVKKRGTEADKAAWLSLLCLAGYLAAWAGFSLVAVTAQWGLEAVGLSDGPMMTIRSRGFAGAVLVAAGLYQLSPIKDRCLSHCRSPIHFLTLNNRPGARGAVLIGLHHGTYCLGCCWALMALLFVGGVMNLYWIAGLAVYVLVEKMMPAGRWFARITGAGLVGYGLYLMPLPAV